MNTNIDSITEETEVAVPETEVADADAPTTDTSEVVGTDAAGADATADTIGMSELKNSIEQVDAWSAQKLGIE